MRIFKATEAPAVAAVSTDCEVTYLMASHGLTRAQAVRTAAATASWEYMLDPSTMVSVDAEMERLDAYDEAVANENWRDRVMSDVGETGAGMIVAIGAVISSVLYMAWLGAYLQAMS